MLAKEPAILDCRISRIACTSEVVSRATGEAKATPMKEMKNRMATLAILENCIMDGYVTGGDASGKASST
jgi:hypothetical protein